MIVLICGDRNWKDRSKIKRQFLRVGPNKISAVVQGMALGADLLGGSCADELGIPNIGIKANWDFYHKAAGPIRNKWMITFIKVDEVWAFHSDLSKSKGTADMVRQAKKAAIPVKVFT